MVIFIIKSLKESLYNEIKIMRSLPENDNIVKLYEVYEAD